MLTSVPLHFRYIWLGIRTSRFFAWSFRRFVSFLAPFFVAPFCLREGKRAVVVDLSDDLDASFVASTPSSHVDLISELQRHIKANHALVLTLMEELQKCNITGSATTTFDHRPPSGDPWYECSGGPLLPAVFRAPEDCISLFAQESSIQKTSGREASFRYFSSIDLVVEPNLSLPQLDIHALGLLENVFYVSDLLQLSERKDDAASFRNMSEQLLSALTQLPIV